MGAEATCSIYTMLAPYNQENVKQMHYRVTNEMSTHLSIFFICTIAIAGNYECCTPANYPPPPPPPRLFIFLAQKPSNEWTNIFSQSSFPWGFYGTSLHQGNRRATATQKLTCLKNKHTLLYRNTKHGCCATITVFHRFAHAFELQKFILEYSI